MFHLISGINVLASPSVLQSTGSASPSSQVPNWKAAPLPSTCATTCWCSPEAPLPSPLATGNCLRCVDTAPCQMALFLREELAADTVSNMWTERVFLTSDAPACSQKRARNSHEQCAAFQAFFYILRQNAAGAGFEGGCQKLPLIIDHKTLQNKGHFSEQHGAKHNEASGTVKQPGIHGKKEQQLSIKEWCTVVLCCCVCVCRVTRQHLRQIWSSSLTQSTQEATKC